ncbi:hypothetical protein BFW88_12700, partial [Pseudomonas fluorescens]
HKVLKVNGVIVLERLDRPSLKRKQCVGTHVANAKPIDAVLWIRGGTQQNGGMCGVGMIEVFSALRQKAA